MLDDLGTQTSTPWAREKLDQLLTYRFNSQLPTVIVTGTTIEELGERMRTRLSDPELCQTYVVEEKRSASLEYTWGPQFELQKSMTIVQAISLAGGLAEWADAADMRLIRKINGVEQTFRVDYHAIVSGEDLSQNVQLQPDDTLFVP